MPARDIFHETVKRGLINDGWTITHDPLYLRVGVRYVFADLGAQRLIGAEKGNEKIAVEIKSFIGDSAIRDLEVAIGQYILYATVLAENQPDRQLYLAVNEETYEGILSEAIGEMVIEAQRIRLIIFDEETEEIIRWIKN